MKFGGGNDVGAVPGCFCNLSNITNTTTKMNRE
jgi:hypothetical protein